MNGRHETHSVASPAAVRSASHSRTWGGTRCSRNVACSTPYSYINLQYSCRGRGRPSSCSRRAAAAAADIELRVCARELVAAKKGLYKSGALRRRAGGLAAHTAAAAAAGAMQRRRRRRRRRQKAVHVLGVHYSS
eukprot:SAG22_NODE_1668_length_3850_cov_3.516662_3_plen_135_part_00